MTRIEFNQFVADDMKGRWPKWDATDAILEDWWSVLRYHSIDVARSAVQEHRVSDRARVFEPIIGAVVNILRRRGRGPVAEVERFDPWIRCLEPPAEHPDWAGKEWYRTDGFRRNDNHDKAYVAQVASDIAALVEQREGGRWCGVVRPLNQPPEDQPQLQGRQAREWAEDHVRNGPEGPGRRWLCDRRPLLKSVPVYKPKTVASQQDLERLTQPAAEPKPSGPTPFDLPFDVEEDEL